MWLAAHKNHLEITQFLLESGSDLEVGDIVSIYYDSLFFLISFSVCQWDSRSALWIATSMGHTEIMSVLIEAGADLNHPNKVNLMYI